VFVDLSIQHATRMRLLSPVACLTGPYFFHILSHKRQDFRGKNTESKMSVLNFCTTDERKTNLMHPLYIFIVAVGDALHVSGVFAHRQER
jgi:hypothetical protein